MLRLPAKRHCGLKPGFSLVELVIVLVLVSITAAIAAPRFSQATARQEVKAAADRLVADFNLARTRANAASQPVTITFDLEQSSYSFNASGGSAFTVALSESPYNVKISSADFKGASQVTFNAFGIPDNTGQVILSSSAGSRTVILMQSGEATQ